MAATRHQPSAHSRAAWDQGLKRKLSPYGVFASFADQFETIWATATPVGNPLSLAIQPEV